MHGAPGATSATSDCCRHTSHVQRDHLVPTCSCSTEAMCVWGPGVQALSTVLPSAAVWTSCRAQGSRSTDPATLCLPGRSGRSAHCPGCCASTQPGSGWGSPSPGSPQGTELLCVHTGAGSGAVKV